MHNKCYVPLLCLNIDLFLTAHSYTFSRGIYSHLGARSFVVPFLEAIKARHLYSDLPHEKIYCPKGSVTFHTWSLHIINIG